MIKKTPTVFMHIPKTAGTTLSQIFRDKIPSDRTLDHDHYQLKGRKPHELDEDEISKIDFVMGHYYYGVHRIFGENATYLTMLRHPVERFLSLYSFVRFFPGYEWTRDMSLEVFLREVDEAKDLQAKMITGDLDAPSPEKAKQHLESFAWVGITEMFDESLFLLKETLRWDDVKYKVLNVTENRIKENQVTKEQIKIIEENNQVDLDVYDFACNLFLNRLSEIDKDSLKRMEEFKSTARVEVA